MRWPTEFDLEFVDNHLKMLEECYQIFKKGKTKEEEKYRKALEYLSFNVESLDIFLRQLMYKKEDERYKSKYLGEEQKVKK